MYVPLGSSLPNCDPKVKPIFHGVCCLSYFKAVSKSVQVLPNGIEAVMVLTSRILD